MLPDAKANSKIHTVSISKRGLSAHDSSHARDAPLLATPKLWLGAASPFGLALPDATPGDATMYAPRGVWMDHERLIVCDSGNHRVLIWNSIPASDHTSADVVLGQADFESEGPAAAGRGPENGLHLPTGILVIDGKLVVGDAWHHRVLVWNEIPVTSDTPPDYAIGQPDLSSVQVNRGAKPHSGSMNWPYGIAWIDGRLYVADTGNRRVLIWNAFPACDQQADVVLGQRSESDGEENRGGPVAADSFRWPHDFAGFRDELFVADAGNHRVLGWNEQPRVDRPADNLIGQQDFTTAFELPYNAQGACRLRFPYAVDCCQNVLAVADTGNNRILLWRLPLSESRFTPAFDVIGQIDFAANGENRWQSVDERSLCWPYGICFHKGALAIADSGNNRVMIWDCHQVIKYANEIDGE